MTPLFQSFHILCFIYTREPSTVCFATWKYYINIFNLSNKKNKRERERARTVEKILCKNSAIYLESGISITRLKTLMALQFNFQGTSRDEEQDTKWQILRAT